MTADDSLADRSRNQPRRDVAQVPLQGGYVAKRCPLRVQFDVFPPPEVEPLPASPFARALMDDGVAFEADVFAEIASRHGDVLMIDEAVHRDERRVLTQQAMSDGRQVILGGELPADLVGRRVGKPDVLVRAQKLGDIWAYHPVDAKHHRTVAASTKPDTPLARCSNLTGLAFAGAAPLPGWKASENKDDLLQLAHYHRMLAATGHASSTPVGGIIGKERHVTWYDLGAPMFRQRWFGQQHPEESALELYDFEFSFRLDVLAAAADQQPIVGPVLTSECSACPWHGKCVPEMEAADCLSLLPRYGYKEWRIHRSHGITTRTEVARLDWRSASLRDAYNQIGDLASDVATARSVPPEAPVEDIVGTKAGRKIAALHAHDVRIASDLLALNPAVVATAKRPIRKLADAIDQARVATVGLGAPHRRRHIDRLSIPVADIEIDIDMENALDGTVYLWGTYDGHRYLPTVSWEPAGPNVEADVFARFWDWLTRTRLDAEAAGQRVVFYCWSENAEITALKNGAQAAAEQLGRTGDPAEVAAFIASGQLVDLMRVFNDQVLTGGSAGLKRIAPHTGFQWRADDAGGDVSMLWHAEATTAEDPGVRATLQQRLLTYNDDDVRATSAVRHWLRTTPLPSVADLEPPA